ncbi:MAG: NAD(P)H-dependent oxidoreductase [Solirubrobacterales bacterium]
MSSAMKRVVLISASPKIGEPSASDLLVTWQESRMEANGVSYERIDVRHCLARKETDAAFAAMLAADALIITFPLYFFCLPGMLMRFLQDYYQYWAQRNDEARPAQVYAVVNCGFPEPSINEEAVRVVQSFSDKIGAVFRFGLKISGGGMLLGAKDAPIMKKTIAHLNSAFDTMAKDIVTGGSAPLANIEIAMNFPRRLYLWVGNWGWGSMARKNGLKKRDLYRKPYRP